MPSLDDCAYEVRLKSEAAEDFVRIYNYIADELQSPESAEKVCGLIEKACASLETYPNRGSIARTPLLERFCCRVIKAANYLIFYTIGEANSVVLVRSIMYRKQDFRYMTIQTDE
ncbi:MAG: type II toxin-antitoxin system RelE/ParE family toxin [Oscillospiraceae bacterium]|jgi:toxin ParE1/3/4|nr:type II toxin-antitoxin system RelE/ParE family toxin [Oscillospiraceae bacterium]